MEQEKIEKAKFLWKTVLWSLGILFFIGMKMGCGICEVLLWIIAIPAAFFTIANSIAEKRQNKNKERLRYSRK